MFSIRITVKNIAQWIGFLRTIPAAVRPIAVKAFATYMLEKLRDYPKYQYVSRRAAYGKSFFSEAQRRWFWASGGPGMIGNHRSYRLQASWKVQGEGTKTLIVNTAPHAQWVVGSGQARQPGMVGWQKVWDTIINNMGGGIAASQRAVDAWLASK